MENLSPDYLSINRRASLMTHPCTKGRMCTAAHITLCPWFFFFSSVHARTKTLGFKTSCFGLTSCGYVLLMSHSQSFRGARLLNSLKLNSNFSNFFFLAPSFLSALTLGIWPVPAVTRVPAPSPRHLSSTFKGLGVCMRTSALSARL